MTTDARSNGGRRMKWCLAFHTIKIGTPMAQRWTGEGRNWTIQMSKDGNGWRPCRSLGLVWIELRSLDLERRQNIEMVAKLWHHCMWSQ